MWLALDGGRRLVVRAQAGAASRPAAGAQRRERARRLLVRLVFLLYLLLIFEGSLRKWVLPEFSRYIFFIRDPVLLAIYALATVHGLWPRRQPWLAAAIGMAVLGLLLALVQSAAGGASEHRLVLTVHGVRSYFLYLPLAFVIGAQFQRDDLHRLYRLTLWLAVPIAVLVALQFFAHPGAPINVGIASDEALQFKGLTATVERTRPMGPFASGAGQQQFVATAWGIVLGGLLLAARARWMPLPWLLFCAAAVLVCIGFSGSRGTVGQCGIATAFALLLGLVGRGAAIKTRALVWTGVLIGLAIALYPVLLPEGHLALTQRWTAAAKVEEAGGGLLGRSLYGLIDFVRLVDEVPILGYGLGFGSNASITLGAVVDGIQPGTLVETDFARHMVDLGPVFGIAYIGFRLLLAAWVFAIAWRATRRSADPMPMLLVSYVGSLLVMNQITGQGAINGYCWLFTGVLIAACRTIATPARQAAQGATPIRADMRRPLR